MRVLGLSLAILSFGSSIVVAGSVMAAIQSTSAVSLPVWGSGVLSDIAAIANGVLEGNHPAISATLGWVSLVFGIGGMTNGIYAAGRAGYREIKKISNFVGDWQYRLQHSGGGYLYLDG